MNMDTHATPALPPGPCAYVEHSSADLCAAHPASQGAGSPPDASPPGESLSAMSFARARRSALIGGSISGVRNAWAALKGRKKPIEAARDTLIDTAASAAAGAVGGVVHHAFSGVGLGRLARGSIPAAIGVTLVDIGRDAFRLSRDRIEPRLFKEKIVVHVFRGGTTWAGMETGAILGSLVLPVIGSTIGGIAGGLLGYEAGTWLADG